MVVGLNGAQNILLNEIVIIEMLSQRADGGSILVTASVAGE